MAPCGTCLAMGITSCFTRVGRAFSPAHRDFNGGPATTFGFLGIASDRLGTRSLIRSTRVSAVYSPWALCSSSTSAGAASQGR